MNILKLHSSPNPRQQGGRRFSMTQRIELKIGNVLDKLKRIESDSVDCIVSSPPYYGLRKYKAPDVDWGDWKGQLGLEPTYKMYLDHLLLITAELKRVLKPTGTLWWNMGDSYNGNKKGKTDKKVAEYVEQTQKGLHKELQDMPAKSLMQLPQRFAIRMQDEQDWILRNTMIWKKRNHMPSSVKDRLANSYEFIFFFTKQKRYFFNLDAVRVPNKVVGVTDMRPPVLRQKLYQKSYTRYATADDSHLAQYSKSHSGYVNYDGSLRFNPLGKNPGDVLELSTQPFKGSHFAVFPPKLPEFCIKVGSPENGVILEPFAGSGTTLMVARQLGRSAIGIELSEEYAKMIKQRLGWGCGLDIEWKED